MDMTHKELAMLWAHYINQRGTDKQVARIMSSLTVEALIRMLTQRGVLANK